MGRADMTSVPVFPGGKKKAATQCVPLWHQQRDTHRSPRPSGVLLGSGETSVLSLSPQLHFWGVLKLSQHSQAGKGPRKPQMSHSI